MASEEIFFRVKRKEEPQKPAQQFDVERFTLRKNEIIVLQKIPRPKYRPDEQKLDEKVVKEEVCEKTQHVEEDSRSESFSAENLEELE